LGLFGGSNSIFNNPSQLYGGSGNSGIASDVASLYSGNAYAEFYTGAYNYISSLLHPSSPSTQSAPTPPSASSVTGGSLQETLNQEQQQYNASTLLNGGGGLPMSQSPITASNVLRAGTR